MNYVVTRDGCTGNEIESKTSFVSRDTNGENIRTGEQSEETK